MNTHKRAIAFFVVLAFIALLQVSAMPLRADQAPDRSAAAAASPEQGPSYIEEEGSSSSAGKKSIVPVVLIGLGVAALAAVLVLVVLKTKYDIVGTWDFSCTSTSPSHTWIWTLIFTGDKKSGSFVDEFNDRGTYSVSGKDVTLKYSPPWDDKIFFTNVRFDDKDKISGNLTFTGVTIGGKNITSATFIATRISGSAAVPKAPAAIAAPGQNARKSI